MLARIMKCPVLIDDLAARRFVSGLGLEVVSSIGVLIRYAKLQKISKNEALGALDKLSLVMWLSLDVYEDTRKIIEKPGRTNVSVRRPAGVNPTAKFAKILLLRFAFFANFAVSIFGFFQQ